MPWCGPSRDDQECHAIDDYINTLRHLCEIRYSAGGKGGNRNASVELMRGSRAAIFLRAVNTMPSAQAFDERTAYQQKEQSASFVS